MKVYILNHTRNDEELDGYKIIGIFSSEEKAKEVINRLVNQPGFKEFPENFNIGGYELDKVFWAEGFIW